MPSTTVERVGDGVVIRPWFDPVARPFESLTDADFDAAWEAPMQSVIEALQAAHRDSIRRIVVVVPTIGMSGAACYSHVAATAEAIRVLVKSAARRWGRSGICVNAVAVAPTLDSPAAAGPTSLAPAAFADAEPPDALIRYLCSDAAAGTTGQTITVDGGVWM